MAGLIDCLGKIEVDKSTKDFLLKRREELIKKGMPELEAERTALSHIHEKIFNDLNDLKGKYGIKKEAKYSKVDNAAKIAEINKAHDLKKEELLHRDLSPEEIKAAKSITPEQIKAMEEGGITINNIDKFKSLFDGNPYTTEDLAAIKSHLSETDSSHNATREPSKGSEGKQQEEKGNSGGDKVKEPITTKEGLSKEIDNILGVMDKLSTGKGGTAEDYVKKAKPILDALFPDHKLVVHNTEAEYRAKEGRPEGSAGVFHPETKTIALNLERINKSNAGNTVIHEVIHPIVREALESRPHAIDDAYSKLVALQSESGMDAVWKHEEMYRDRGSNTMKVEAVTEFLTQVADGRINTDNLHKDLITKVIDAINSVLKAVGIDKQISTAGDLKSLADAIKKGFETGDAKSIADVLGKKTDGLPSESLDAIKPSEKDEKIKEALSRSTLTDAEKRSVLEGKGFEKSHIDSLLGVEQKNVSHGTIEGKPTGIKNEVYDEERAAENKPVNSGGNISSEEHFKKVSERIKSGEISEADINGATAMAIAGHPDPKYTPSEVQDILIHNKIQLNNQYEQVFNELEKNINSKNSEGIANAVAKQAALEAQMEANYQASKKTGSEWSQAGRQRQLELLKDFSVSNLMQRYKVAGLNNAVPEGIKKYITQQAKIIENKTKAVVEKTTIIDKLQKEINDLKAGKDKVDGFDEMKKDAKAIKKTTSKDLVSNKKKEVLNNIREKWNKLNREKSKSESLDAIVPEDNEPEKVQKNAIPLPEELKPDIARLARLEVMDGARTIEEVVDRVHEKLKEFGDIDKRTISDAISDYGKKKGMSQEEIDIAMREVKRQGRLVSSLEDVSQGKLPERSGLQRDKDTERVKELKKLIADEMRANGIEIEKSAKDPEEKWKSALDAYKTKLQNEQAKIESALKNNKIDEYIAGKKREKLKLDAEAEKMKADLQRNKNEINKIIKQKEYDNRGKLFKTLDFASRMKRNFLVSSVQTLEKLLGAAFWRPVLKAPTDVANYLISKSLGKFSEGSSYAITNRNDLASSLAKYYHSFFEGETWKAAWDKLKTGHSNADINYGKDKFDVGPKDIFSRTLEQWVRLHGAIKEPVKQAESNSATIRALSYLIRQGEDPENPLTIQKAKVLGLGEGLRDILMQDNYYTSIQKAAEKMLENKGKYIQEFALKSQLPITKIASNYLAESSSFAAGGVKAGIMALTKIGKTMTLEEKNYVIRNLTKQTLGVGIFAIGWAGYKSIAPYYGSVSSKKVDDLPEDGIMLGMDKHLVHNPMFDLMRAAATYRWKLEEMHNSDKEPGPEPALKAGMGMIMESPYLQEINKLGKVLDPKANLTVNTGNFLGEFVAQQILPPDLEKLAKKLDHDRKVKAKGFTQTIQKKIPGLRNQLEEKE